MFLLLPLTPLPQFSPPLPSTSPGQQPPLVAAALQQMLSLQAVGGLPSSSSLLQQVQALSQLAGLAQLQSMFLLQHQPKVCCS